MRILGKLELPLKTDFFCPHRLCYSRISDVEIGRLAQIQAAEQAMAARHAHRIHADRISNPILAVFSAPGGGKSRFLDMLGKHVTSGGVGSDLPSCLRGSVVLAISYNGVTGTPSDYMENSFSPGFGLSARILWSYLVDFGEGVTSGHFILFCQSLLAINPTLFPSNVLGAVIKRHGCPVLLLVDELINAEVVAQDQPFRILSCIGGLLDDYASCHAVVTSLKPSPVFRLESQSRRPVTWIPLPPFTVQESLHVFKPLLDRHANLGMNEIVKLCVSDVGGHPRGLQFLNTILASILVSDMSAVEIVEAVVAEFAKLITTAGPLSANVVKMALRGNSVPLSQELDGSSVERLTSDGVFLNSEVGVPSPTAIVPRLSIMVLRVFEAGVAAESQPELAACLREVAISSTLNFDFNNMELFHAHWEVLARLVGWTGKMSLAKFYSRNDRRRKPMATECVVIDFCLKTDSIIEWRDKRSIFGASFDKASCCAVYTAKSGQPGFDMVTFEKKAEGGYVAIFVDNKYSRPGSTKELGSKEVRKKWAHCIAWCKSSLACKKLGVTADQCFLVIASWRHGNPRSIQDRELLDKDSHILVLGREDLTRLYTPTLVSRVHFIDGQSIVRVEDPLWRVRGTCYPLAKFQHPSRCFVTRRDPGR